MTPTPTTMTEADGWKLVPTNPTEEMLLAGDYGPVHVLGMWRAMLSAAPPAPVPDDLRLYDGTAPMSDGGDTPMTAAEEVLAWLLIEKIGSPDDVPYSPDQAQDIISARIARLESENARLREALAPLGDCVGLTDGTRIILVLETEEAARAAAMGLFEAIEAARTV